jgi:GNAT superfamily N-acetyltransferase
MIVVPYQKGRQDQTAEIGGFGIHMLMDREDVLRRILQQRAIRYTERIPTLVPVGTARFRLETDRIRLAYASVPSGRASEAVARVVDFARKRHLQVQWLVVPQRSGEAELAPALQDAGFDLAEDLLLMAHATSPAAAGLDSGGVCPPPTDRPGTYQTTIQPIAQRDHMLAYEYGSRLCFYEESEPVETMVSQRAVERWQEQQAGWYRYYAALDGQRLLGGCYASLFEDIPTVMGVYTMPDARHRGVAGQLVAHVVCDLAGDGRPVCCLFVEKNNPAKNLYRELRFEPLVDMLTYTRSADLP